VTNRDQLRTPRERLRPADRQRRFLLEVAGTRLPCPACGALVDALAAAGVDVDAYDFGRAALTYRCPGCGAELEQAAPAFPGGLLPVAVGDPTGAAAGDTRSAPRRR
jgi:hypothetical protein